ncbi:hypothetical protein AWC16_11360 [Mycolicibacter longobardus]|uniref:Uncharacterized protein n=1 Tax=Mycolicibacter longobardus TaxID=1108812 RepID=A0A1X1YJH5_9MYCO|nr:hypothetical protein AWC16_11360 [Mycolicibacter longobardus]
MEAVKQTAVGRVMALRQVIAALVGAVKRAVVGPVVALRPEIMATVLRAVSQLEPPDRPAVSLACREAAVEVERPVSAGRAAALAVHHP